MNAAQLWVCAALLLALGEAVAFAFAAPVAGAWPFMAAFAAIAAFARSRAALAAGVVLAGAALASHELLARRSEMDSFAVHSADGRVSLQLDIPQTVYSAPGRKGGTYVAFNSSEGAMPLRIRTVIPAGGAVPVQGERWVFRGQFNPSAADNLTKAAQFWATESARKEPAPPAGLLDRVREDVSSRIGIGLETMPRAADMLRAMLLGEKSRLDKTSRDAFAASGTIHVFAISGLHIVVVAQVLFVLLSLFMPMRGACVALVPALWCYAIMTGASPSAMRAAAMTTLCCLAPASWRRPDAVVAWAVVFTAFHIARPAMLFNVASLLSFTVMLAIAMWLRWGVVFDSRLGDAFALTLVAWTAGVPLVACLFGRFTIGGIVANLIALPAAAMAIVAGLCGILASFVSSAIAAHLNAFAAAAIGVMDGVSRTVASMPFVDFQVMPWTPAACAAWYAASFALAAFAVAAVRRSRRFL